MPRPTTACSPRASILPGIRIATLHPGSVATALIVGGSGPVGAISVGNNWFGDTLVLKFSPAVAAVAWDMFGNTSYGTSLAGSMSVQFISGTKMIGSHGFSEAAGGSVFVGVTSSSLAITAVRINWTSDGDATTYISDIAFGTPAVP